MSIFFAKNGSPRIGRIVGTLVTLMIVFSSLYIVEEGHIGVVKRTGEAIGDAEPGLHMKVPLIDSVESIEIRTRKYTQTMTASTTGKNGDGTVELQMPSTVTVSANWNIPKKAALDIYKQYGGLEQYESRILDPRVLKVTKQVFAKHTIEDAMSRREVLTQEIATGLKSELSGLLASMTDINIEDIKMPPSIRKSIERKQNSKLNAEAEAYKLEQKDLEAQRKTKVAEAEAAGIRATSIEKAAAIKREGEAEAAAIKAKARALRNNPLIVDLTRAQQWDGKFPATMMGEGTNILWNMK